MKEKAVFIMELSKEMQTYKKFLIDGILDFQLHNEFTREKLETKTIRELEKIYDHIGL